MAIGEFQRALADMTLDTRLAAAVRSNGTAALEDYSLTEREERRLETVARQPGMSLTCTLARANRFGPIHNAFPMTCVLLEAQLKALLDELWHKHRPDNYQLAGEDTAFAELIENKLAAGELDLEYLEEVFRFEQACLALAMELRYRDAASVEGQTRVVQFRHDPGELFDTLGRLKAPPARLPLDDFEVHLHLTGGELEVTWNNGPASPD